MWSLPYVTLMINIFYFQICQTWNLGLLSLLLSWLLLSLLLYRVFQIDLRSGMEGAMGNFAGGIFYQVVGHDMIIVFSRGSNIWWERVYMGGNFLWRWEWANFQGTVFIIYFLYMGHSMSDGPKLQRLGHNPSQILMKFFQMKGIYEIQLSRKF